MSESTAVAKREPTIKDWLQSPQFQEAVRAALPSHLTPERFIRIALTAMMKVPKLAQCSKESIFRAMLDLSSLGLEPDGRRAHLIPYENRKTGKTEAQLIIDYKGLIELAKRSGDVTNWRAELICEADTFSWENGVVSHRVDWLKARGKALAVYSHVRTKDGIDDYEVMTMEQVEGIRRRSKAGNSGPWVTDFSEMAKKTVMRRHSKRLTLSPEFQEAVAKDGDQVVGGDDLPMADLMPKRISEQAIEVPAVEPDVYEDQPPYQVDEEMPPAQEMEAPPPVEASSPRQLTQPQIKRLFYIGKLAGHDAQQIKDHVYASCGCAVDDLSRADYDRICKQWGAK
jgi:recombination protein RecT